MNIARVVAAATFLAPATAFADVAPKCAVSAAGTPTPAFVALVLPLVVVIGAAVARRRSRQLAVRIK